MSEELLKALELIKKECAKHTQCEDCPLADADGICGLKSDQPYDWKLKKREVYF